MKIAAAYAIWGVAASAARTTSGVKGTCRKRLPGASNKALAMAEAHV